MLLSNKEWLSLRWFRRKSYLVDNSFENNYIDFHENLTKGAVPNTKSQTQGRTDGRDLHIKLISYFVKDASRLNLLLFQNTDLQQFIYMQSNKIHELFYWVSLFSTYVSSTCFGPHRSIIRSVLYKLYSQTLVYGNTRTTRHVQPLLLNGWTCRVVRWGPKLVEIT